MAEELTALPDLTTAEIARRFRESHEEVLSWVDPGVETAQGTVRLPARRVGGLDVLVVRPRDLLTFLRRRRGEEVQA